MTSLNVNDRITVTLPDGTIVEAHVSSIAPPQPDAELVAVVFRTLTPRQAAEYNRGRYPIVKRYTYRAPLAWGLKIGDHVTRGGASWATVVGFPEKYTGDRPLRTLDSIRTD